MTALLRSSDRWVHTHKVVHRRAALKLIERRAAPAAQRDTSVHPLAVAIPLGSVAWFIVVSWAAFGGGETSLALAVVTLILTMLAGLLTGGAAYGRNVTWARICGQGFRAFLDGDSEIATGTLSGKQALLQISLMPVVLALGATAIAFIAVTT